MRTFFLLLPSLCLRTAAHDCTSLLSMQTAGNSTLRRDIRIIRQGQCREVKEGDKTTLRDSHVNFHGVNGSTLLEVHFSPTWYSITEGEPIRKDCVYSEDKIKRVKILAGPPRVG